MGASNEGALFGQKFQLRMVMMRVMNDRITRTRDYESMIASENEAISDTRQNDEDPTTELER